MHKLALPSPRHIVIIPTSYGNECGRKGSSTSVNENEGAGWMCKECGKLLRTEKDKLQECEYRCTVKNIKYCMYYLKYKCVRNK